MWEKVEEDEVKGRRLGFYPKPKLISDNSKAMINLVSDGRGDSMQVSENQPAKLCVTLPIWGYLIPTWK